jgi:hypothetical protein
MVECPAGKLAGFFMRFTIRDLLWLTIVVAMGVGWLLSSRHQASETAQAYELARFLEEQLRLSKQLEDPFRLPILKDSN